MCFISVTIHFLSDSSVNDYGFDLRYEVLDSCPLPTTTAAPVTTPWVQPDCESQNSRIIGGESINTGNSPFEARWMVYLGMGCGGSWIGPDTILTAAHCFGEQPSANSVTNIYAFNKTSGRKDYLMNVRGDQITIHEEYYAQYALNDIAIIRTCGYTSDHYIALPPQGAWNQGHQSYWVYGWGNMIASGGADFPDELHWVQTPTV